MSSVLRVVDPRFLLAAVLVVVSLSGCDFFDKKKSPIPGERISVLGDRKDLEADSDVAGMQVVLPPPTVNRSWPQSGGFANNAMHNLAIGDSPQIIWTADVGSGSSSTRILTTPPVVAEGKVFAKDAQSTVSAFNADTGALLWRVTLAPEKARDSDEFGGGLAYYGGRLFVTTGFAMVFSLDPATGKEEWSSSVSAPVRGSPLVFGDRVFVISIDNKLNALAASDGSDLWQFAGLQETAGYVGGNSPAGSGDFVVAPFTSGEVVALRTDNGRPGLERVADRRTSRCSRLRQPGRRSRPSRDRPRSGHRDGIGRPDRRYRAALGPAPVGPQHRRQPDAVDGGPLSVRDDRQRRCGRDGPRYRQGPLGHAAHPIRGCQEAYARPVGGPVLAGTTACC